MRMGNKRMNIGFMGDGRNTSKKASAFDELLASYDPIDYMYGNIDKRETESFIPTETECNDIFGINALEKIVKMMRMDRTSNEDLIRIVRERLGYNDETDEESEDLTRLFGGANERMKYLNEELESDIIEKIRDIVDGTIDHLDRDDALDMLYEIKRLVR